MSQARSSPRESTALVFEERHYSLVAARRTGRRVGGEPAQPGRDGRRAGRVDGVQPPRVRRRATRDLAAGRGRRTDQPGLEARRSRARAGVDESVTRCRRPRGAVGTHADAAPRRADRAGRTGVRLGPPPEADAVLAFSSGTTGLPKAVRHTHASLQAAVRHWRDALSLTARDRIQIATPPSHILGLAQHHDGTADRRMDAPASPIRHRPHAAAHRKSIESRSRWLSRPIALAMASHPHLESYDLSSLRFIMWGATPVSAERRRDRHPAHRRRWVAAYGTTELPGHRLQPARRRPAGLGRAAGARRAGASGVVADRRAGRPG